MASENNAGYRELMSEGLKKMTDKMVFEGVTPKSGMKKVKAMKRLWRSDSFQMMKSILEEPPIQEGRIRPPLQPLPDQDDELDDLSEVDGSPRDTNLVKETKEKDLEYLKKKEELGARYKSCLEEDLHTLQQTADDIVNKLLDDTSTIVKQSKEEQIEELVKQKIIEMKNNIKCYRKNRNKVLKMAVDEDRKQVTDELKDYLERDMEIRLKTYKQLLGKLYDFKIRQLEDSLTDDYDVKIRERIRSSTNKFNFAKEKLLEKQKKDLTKLDCRLSAEFAEHEKWSENRVDTMLEDAIFELEDIDENMEVKAEDSDCSLIDRLVLKLNDEGWLPYKASKNDNWENLVMELMQRYEFLVELALGAKGGQENQFLLSIDKLKYFKDRISEINRSKLTETHDLRKRQKVREKAKLRAASILDHLLRLTLISPPPSRISIGDLNYKPRILCRPRHMTTYKKHTVTSQFIELKRETNFTTSLGRKTIQPRKTQGEQKKQSIYSEENRKSCIDTLRKNPELYNVFFYAR